MKKFRIHPDESETFGEFFRRYHSKDLSNIGPHSVFVGLPNMMDLDGLSSVGKTSTLWRMREAVLASMLVFNLPASMPLPRRWGFRFVNVNQHDVKVGCAACDRGDHSIGHAYWCPHSTEYEKPEYAGDWTWVPNPEYATAIPIRFTFHPGCFAAPLPSFSNFSLTRGVPTVRSFFEYGAEWEGATFVSSQPIDNAELQRAERVCIQMEKMIDAAPFYHTGDGMDERFRNIHEDIAGYPNCIKNGWFHWKLYEPNRGREWNIFIGDPKFTPEGFKRWRDPAKRIIGLKGSVQIVLGQGWYHHIAPRELEVALINLRCNATPPKVTFQ